MADRQAETGSDACALGREERSEEPPDHLWRHTGAGILDLDRDPAGVVHSGADADFVGVRASFVHGLGGVDDEVEEYLAEPGLVRFDGRYRPELRDQLRPVADLVLRHPERRLEDALDVHGLLTLLMRPGEDPQVAGDVP